MKMKECKVWLSVLSAPERIGQIKELTKDLDHVRVIAPSLGAWLEVNAADEGFDIISRNIDDYFSTCPKPEVTYSHAHSQGLRYATPVMRGVRIFIVFLCFYL